MIKHFETQKGSFIAVRVPDGKDVYFTASDALVIKHSKAESIILPPGNWQLIGKARELNEEQWSGIVAYVPYGFYNYEHATDGDLPRNCCKTAKQSGKSLAMANGFYWENQRVKPDREDYESGVFTAMQDFADYKEAMQKWEAAQKEVGEYVILKKI